LLGGAAAAAVAAEVVEVAAVVADSEVVVVVSEVADSEVVAEVSVVATAMAVATAMVATAAISAIAGADTFARTIERSVGPIRNQNEKGASIIRRTFFVNCARASYIDAPLQRGGSLVARESVELVSGDDKNAASSLIWQRSA
jgi:Na+/proline symporter